MQNVLIGYNNLTDASVLTGGSWMPSLPLNNLQNTRVGVVARSVDATNASTKFVVNLQALQKIKLVSLVNHNFSIGSSYRVRAYQDAAMSVLLADTGVISTWPVLYSTLTLDWEDANDWSGLPTLDQIVGYNWSVIAQLPSIVAAQYLLIEIFDISNSAGFVQFGRLFVGQTWQPQVNAEYGKLSMAWETSTVVNSALSGAEYFDKRTPYRVARFSTDWLNVDEAYGAAFDIQRRLGVDGECVFMYDPDDTLYALRRQFYGRLRTLNAIEAPLLNVNSTAWEIKERI